MDRPEYNFNSIVISLEAEMGGNLYRQAVALAKAGQYDQAIASAEAITNHNFSLNRYFKNESLAIIVSYCVDAHNFNLAEMIAKKIELGQHRDVAFRHIAFGYIQRGNLDAAIELIDKIESSKIREAVLSEMQAKRNAAIQSINET